MPYISMEIEESGGGATASVDIRSLQLIVDNNPYNYDAHVAYIAGCKNVGDVEGTREGRKAFAKLFPLTSGMYYVFYNYCLPTA
jgi:hypothetical protein